MYPILGGSEISTLTGNNYYDLFLFVVIWVLSIYGLIWSIKRGDDRTIDSYSDNWGWIVCVLSTVVFFLCRRLSA